MPLQRLSPGERTSVEASFEQQLHESPPGAIELLLVRQGKSAPAIRGRSFPMLKGRGNPNLAAAGETQANAIAACLAGQPVDAIVVSPLNRTQQTAAPLAKAKGIEPRIYSSELDKVQLGQPEGGEYRIRVATNDSLVRRVHGEELWEAIPGAERSQDFSARVGRALKVITEMGRPGTSNVVVAHMGVICEVFRQVTDSRRFASFHVNNASISRVIMNPDGTQWLRCFSEAAHMKTDTSSAKAHANA